MNLIDQVLIGRPKPKDWRGERAMHAEAKYDGVRMTFVKRDDRIEAYGRSETRNHISSLEYLTDLMSTLRCMPNETMVDGELHPRVGLSTDVPAAIKAQNPLTYTAFAVPVFSGQDQRFKPLTDARYDLDAMGFKCTALFEVSTREEMLKLARTLDLEGFVLKAGHYNGWYRLKPSETIDAIVISHACGKGRLASATGSFIVGLLDESGHMVEIANVGSGLTDEIRFDARSHVGRVIEVGFDAVTRSRGVLSLRFPTFVRWRDDKPAHECTVSSLLALEKNRDNRC